MVDLSVLGWWLDLVILEVFSSLDEPVTLHSECQVCPDSELERSRSTASLVPLHSQAVTFVFSGVPAAAAAAAAHVAGSPAAAGAGQPARVPAARGPAPAAALPGAGLAGAGQQLPPEAPADLHRATAPARGPFSGNLQLIINVICGFCGAIVTACPFN